MALSPTQLTQLKTDILANTDQQVVDGIANGDFGSIASWYNENASPDYFIYRDAVSSNEVRDVIDAQNIADITDADRGRCVDLLAIRAERGFSGESATDRSAWDDIFSAASGDESQQAINALWSRLATNAEKVFSLSTGSGANAANADTTEWQGYLSFAEVNNALNS